MQRFSPASVLALVVCACTSIAPPHVSPAPASTPAPTRAPAPTATFAGRVVRDDGAPAADAVVLISDPANNVLASLRTGADGSFTTTLTPALYAVTATSAEQSTYAPSIDGTHGAVELRLDTSCERIAGRIDTTSKLPQQAIVRLRRISAFVGDQFGAPVAADGAFHACVPAANYVLDPPEGFVERYALPVIPYAGVLVLRTDARQDADRVPTDFSGLSLQTAEAFVAALPASVKLIGLGETNHGTREFYDERTALVKTLAAKNGVHLLILEAGYGEVLPLDDYANGAAIDIDRAVTELGYWIWDTKTFLHALAELRAYNASVKPAQRIHLIGVDVQDTAAAIKYIEQHGKAMLSAADTSVLAKLTTERGKAWTTLTGDERSTIRAKLEKIAAKRGRNGAGTKPNRVALAARALLLRFDTLEPTAPSEARDTGMARMVMEVLEANRMAAPRCGLTSRILLASTSSVSARWAAISQPRSAVATSSTVFMRSRARRARGITSARSV